jgi:hypothetical protein
MRWRPSLLAALAVAACSSFTSSSDPEGPSAPDAGAVEDGESDAAVADVATSPPDAGMTVIATNQEFANEVIVDEQRVYWTIDDDTGTIRAREHAGGDPYTVITDQLRPKGLSRFSENIYFASGTQARWTLRNSKPAGTTEVAVAPTVINGVVRAGTALWLTAGDHVRWCSMNGNDCATPGVLTSEAYILTARALVANREATALYVASNTHVWTRVFGAGSWAQRWAVSDARAIVADESAVFVATPSRKGLVRWKPSDAPDAAPLPVAYDKGFAYALAMNGTHVFYTEIDDGMVVRVSNDGSKVDVIASGLLRPKGIAATLDRVYVALSDGRIVSIPAN